ncbi:SixA phosphatase family protein [Methylomonas koyamae]|uniref:SixA phosphatase family protein n=1 Tax=Methylomonas koyamae TaxID=702114 RepID=UPI002873300D|nr:histidine phosphatase family protein [Methylomonas koyamae]WNB76691.1 histidine phosphatase family protein [Methylomonas koyamae]
MLITFLRHATAQEHTQAKADADRALTDKGIKQVKRLAAFCERNQLIPGNLFCSPVLRAQQTADLLHAYLPGCPAAQSTDWLAIGAAPHQIGEQLNLLANRGGEDIWLVGHEPDFSECIAQLLNTSADVLCIKKASLTRLEVDFESPHSATLLWSLPCALMR